MESFGAWVRERHFIEAKGLTGQPETQQKINAPTKIPIILKEDGRRTLGEGMKRENIKKQAHLGKEWKRNSQKEGVKSL